MTTHHYQYMGMWCKFQTALPLWKSSLCKMKIDHVIDVVILSVILSDRYVVASHSQCLEATCMCALSTIFLDSPNPVLFGNHWRWRWRHSSPNLPQKVQLLHNIIVCIAPYHISYWKTHHAIMNQMFWYLIPSAAWWCQPFIFPWWAHPTHLSLASIYFIHEYSWVGR